MSRRDQGPACVTAGPVLAGILAIRSAEDVLRCAFAEAQRRDVALHVLAAGPPPAAGEEAMVRDLVDRWAEKYPAVPVTFSRRHGVDAAITLAGAGRRCGVVVVAEPADGHDAAVVRALIRRTDCPLTVASPPS
jgi:hypothetical protein